MIVYFSVLIFILFVCFLSNGKGNGKLPLGVSIFAIYLMISFQAGWGGDYEVYANVFDHYHGMLLEELLTDPKHGEIGYKIVFSIFPSYEVVKFVFSAWYCFAIYILFYCLIPRKWWPFAFFFLFINRPLLMGGISAIARTGFAVASFIFGMYFLANGQKWKYIAILIIASFFHTSSLFFLPLAFVPSKQGKTKASIGVVIFLIIYIIFWMLPSAWTDFVESLLISSDTLSEYEVYLEDEIKKRSFSVLVIFSFIWVYELFVYIKKGGYSRYNYLVMYMALVQIAFSMLPSVGLSNRFYYYLNYGFFAGMMVLLEKEKNENLKWVIVLSLIFVFGKQFLTFYNTPYFAEHWLNYHTIWNY